MSVYGNLKICALCGLLMTTAAISGRGVLRNNSASGSKTASLKDSINNHTANDSSIISYAEFLRFTINNNNKKSSYSMQNNTKEFCELSGIKDKNKIKETVDSINNAQINQLKDLIVQR